MQLSKRHLDRVERAWADPVIDCDFSHRIRHFRYGSTSEKNCPDVAVNIFRKDIVVCRPAYLGGGSIQN